MWNKFLIIFFIPILTVLVILGCFNFSVDPYQLRDVEGKEGLNIGKIYSADRERALKPLMYLRQKPEAVILGDSKSAFSIQPEKVSEILNLKSAFNLSLRSATPYEIYELLKFATEKNKNLKHIIICLDFEMMGQFSETNQGFSKSLLNFGFLPPEDKFSSLFSLATFCDSVETIRENRKKNLSAIYKNNGEISEEYLIDLFKREGNFDRNADIVLTQFKPIEKSKKYRNIYLKSFNRDMLILREIKEFLTEKNIKYSVVILPLHSDELSAVNNIYYRTWKKQIKDIFPDIFDFSLALKDDKNLYYDAAHPKKEPTMLLLKNLFENKKITNHELKINKNIAVGKPFLGEIKIDNSIKTASIILDKKRLEYDVLHLTSDTNIKSENAYFLLENNEAKFLFKATRYGEPMSQDIISQVTKNYKKFPLDGRGIIDNLPRGEYKIYVGEIKDDVFVTDGVKEIIALL